MNNEARQELYEKIVSMLIRHDVEDVDDIGNELYIIMDKYEITARTTEIAVLSEDRNEYLLKKFIIAKTVKGCTKRTIYFYKKTLVYILQEINKTVDDITADDIRYYLAVRQKRDGITKTTADNELRCLRTFFTYLTTEEILTRNPTAKIDRIKRSTSQKYAFSELEVELIRDALKDGREKALVELLLSTGCRVSEVVQIKLEEINGDSILVHGKGEKDRVVYINAKAQIALKNYMEERKDNNPYLFAGGNFNTPGIRKKKGDWYKYPELIAENTHADKGTIESIVRKIGKRADIKSCHPHRFRRTCATLALKRGMPIEKVSKMLGHEQITTTQIYLNIDEEELQQAHKKYVV